jgi:hypothetical protein
VINGDKRDKRDGGDKRDKRDRLSFGDKKT